MTTAAVSTSAHVPASDVYDPDDVLPQNSPLLAATIVNLQPSPSPPPFVQISPPSSPGAGRKTKRRYKVRPSQGDAVLVGIMDSGRRPDIANMAGERALPSDISEETSSTPESDSSSDEEGSYTGSVSPGRDTKHRNDDDASNDTPNGHGVPAPSPGLQSLAMLALGLGESDANRTPTTADEMDTDISPAAGAKPDGPVRRDVIPQPIIASPPYSAQGHFSPQYATLTQRSVDPRSPTGSIADLHGELAPIQDASPRSETNGTTKLPSIRDQLGDIRSLPPGPEVVSPAYSSHQSPSGAHVMHRLPGLNVASPPLSPNDPFTRSPHHVMGGMPSPYNPFPPNGMYHRSSVDYNSSSTNQTPSTDQSASTPATSTHSVADKMSIDGMAFNNPQEAGGFVCKFDGCSAAPFQTQYLLNSHANVHSSSRPHYCSVKGCPRSEGGKGFKRKNEMIRHGLVHESPGYVCPFCPEREHKYPRPDNLQRYETRS